jgi:hypothetical protein
MADRHQTLLTQYQRAKEMKTLMPEMAKGVIEGERPIDLTNLDSEIDRIMGNRAGAGASPTAPPTVGSVVTYQGKSYRVTGIANGHAQLAPLP